jgi:hypothetical protein
VPLAQNQFSSNLQILKSRAVKKLDFLGVSSKLATFSKGDLGGFLGDFKESLGAIEPQAPISRRKCHFLSRLFADRLFDSPAIEGWVVNFFVPHFSFFSLFLYSTFLIIGATAPKKPIRSADVSSAHAPIVEAASCRSCPKCGRMPHLRINRAKSFTNRHLTRLPSKFFGQQISNISLF